MTKAEVNIREETSGDYPAVRRVNEAAFDRVAEADLVEALRRAASHYLSLVAEASGNVVGHIFFSPVTIDAEGTAGKAPGEPPLRALGLAPMAVLAEHQGHGIGSALVRAGLAACQHAGYSAVFVLGHPEYYPRFGFAPAHTRGFTSEYDVPPEVFMVVELDEGALAGRSGRVRYHPAFKEMT